LDGLDADQWRKVASDAYAYAAYDASAASAASDAYAAYAASAASDAYAASAYDAYACGYRARYAAYEIMGADYMIERGKPFYFLRLFGFDSPDTLPA
jgi:hypothetical protein